jgi:HPt (histidine-containing phosphotransfer) domain-containing protein
MAQHAVGRCAFEPTHLVYLSPFFWMTMTLDLSVLDTLANHDATKLRKYSLLFIASLEEVLAQVDDGIARTDCSLLGAMGHRAKSTALNIGATGLSAQCLLLEQAATTHDTVAAMALAHTLRPMFLPIRAALLQHLEA